MNLHERLKSKGWPEHEIKRALTILKYGKSNQQNFPLYTHRHKASWIGLMVLINISIILSLMMIPFLLVVKNSLVYLFIILFALGFGYIFDYLLRDIDFSFPKHHVVAWVFIPIVIAIIIGVIYLTNYILGITGMFRDPYNPVYICIIYIVSFVTPYLFNRSFEL